MEQSNESRGIHQSHHEKYGNQLYGLVLIFCELNGDMS